MLTSTLLNPILSLDLNTDILIKDLSLDSRKVKPGDLFFALQGTHLDGTKFIADAIQKGAVCVVAEGDSKVVLEKNIPVIFVPALSKKIGEIAARFYGNPTREMHVVGVTGTNGKTSCSYFIASALSQDNLPCGVIGTLGNGLYGAIQETNLTTPDAITLQKTFAEFLKQNARYAAMEVSSHSIDQGRINGVDFEVAVFTNLTRDHLDYHGTMENYGNTKKKLFVNSNTKHAVINADDDFGKKIIGELRGKKSLYAYSTQKLSAPKDVPVIFTENIQLDLTGIRANVFSPWGDGEIFSPLIGQFNISNLLAAFTTLCLLEVPFEKSLQLISTLKPVPGRMQTFTAKNKPLVVVDYAHTPDALEKALQALRHHCRGELFCVFGCGGDRDRGKRPMMATIAEKFSDCVMMTDDNPRTENAEQIFEDILKGFSHPENILREHDRAAAIQKIIHTAKAGDVILVAGKGAEDYQIIGEEKIAFSDLEVVSASLC